MKSVTKLYYYSYALVKCLVSQARSPREDIKKAWRYTRNGVVVMTGANLLQIIMEITSFFYKHGCPVKECPFLKPALRAMNVPEPEHEWVLEGILDPEFLDLDYSDLIAKVDAITGSGVYRILTEAVKIMEGYMHIYTRSSAAAHQLCLMFTLTPDQPETGKTPLSVFNDASSRGYSEMFQQLTYYIYQNHIPVIGNNVVDKLLILKPLGLSMEKFYGFIQCESRAEEEAKDDGSYSSGTAIQELFGFSSEWAGVKEMLMNSVAPHLAQISRNAELHYEAQAKLDEIYCLMALMADISNLKSKSSLDVLDIGSGNPEQNKELVDRTKLIGLLKKYKEWSKDHGPADKPVNATGSASVEPESKKNDPLMD